MSKWLGYQKDPKASIQEARQLRAEAGGPNGLKNLDFLVREITTLKLWAVAAQAMFKEALNIETKLRTVQVAVWFDEPRQATTTLPSAPSCRRSWSRLTIATPGMGKNGPQNYSPWFNNAFQELVKQIDCELDPEKRKALMG